MRQNTTYAHCWWERNEWLEELLLLLSLWKKNFDAVTAYCETGLGGYFKKGKAFFFSLPFMRVNSQYLKQARVWEFSTKKVSVALYVGVPKHA